MKGAFMRKTGLVISGCLLITIIVSYHTMSLGEAKLNKIFLYLADKENCSNPRWINNNLIMYIKNDIKFITPTIHYDLLSSLWLFDTNTNTSTKLLSEGDNNLMQLSDYTWMSPDNKYKLALESKGMVFKDLQNDRQAYKYSISPNNNIIIYCYKILQILNVYKLDIEEMKVNKLMDIKIKENLNDISFQWTSKGDKFFILIDYRLSDKKSYIDLYKYDTKSSNQAMISIRPNKFNLIGEIKISNNGNQLAYYEYNLNKGTFEASLLNIMELNSQKTNSVHYNKSVDRIWSWSPDDSKLAITMFVNKSSLSNKIAIYNLGQQKMIEIANGNRNEDIIHSDVKWSPNGKRICYLKGKEGKMQLWIANIPSNNSK